jgi:tripartite-type tricarboxylate transporter receptor subunit TctC
MRLLIALLAALLLVSPSHAQNYPIKPVRLVVPYTAGGSGDITARAIAEKLSNRWGQTVVVDNRPGANGNLGAETVARAPADGYTLLLASDIQLAITPHLYKKLTFDPLKDLDPVSLVAYVDVVLVAHPSVAAGTVGEFATLARANPTKFSYASTGTGSTHQLAIELLKSQGEFNVTHIPYKGSSQAIPDLVSGQVQIMLLGVPQVLPFLKENKLKALGVGSAHRLAMLPNVPTIAESGVRGFEVRNYWNLMVPSGTPVGIVDKLQRDVAQVVRDESLRQRFSELGLEAFGSTPQQLREQVAKDSAKWKDVIQRLKITLE